MDIFWGHPFIFPAPALTFKGQVAEESSQEVHGVHDKDGDVRHLLHSLLGRTKIGEEFYKYNIQHRHAVRIMYGVKEGWLTCGARCRWGGPRGGTRRRKQGWEWCMLSARSTGVWEFLSWSRKTKCESPTWRGHLVAAMCENKPDKQQTRCNFLPGS